MEFQTLSHAGLRVAGGGKELLCDPWVVGSVYWRSWWNYPAVPRELVDTLKPDFVYLTHLHWDHFQAASLRRFPDDVQMIVPYDRHGRMVRDLQHVGKTNIRELKHGERAELAPGLAVTSFHIGPVVTDSALVIEAGDQVLLNANDAKFLGLPLRQILKRHPKIDFCFRSHSSANSRVCYHYLDAPDEATDDNDHYLRAFSLFMQAVKPRYAIPFASNSCLLHDDVWHLNPLVQTPLEVERYFAAFAAEHGLDTKLQIMIPGDKWIDGQGFELREHDYFTNREAHLEAYRARVQPTMAKQRQLEARVSVNVKMVERFFGQLARNVPFFLKRPLKGREVLLVARSEKGDRGFAVDLAGGGKVRQVEPAGFDAFTMRIEYPAVILLQSITMNMFAHAGISKRVHYYASKADMPVLKRFARLCEGAEGELFPLSAHLKPRSLKALLPRWREGVLYVQMLADLARGKDLPTIEAARLQPA
jgi:UDP-MurNAc hydroxylase